ncbi:MAG: Beta-galactosidase C-terminal domain, partial [Mycobacteriales bacterium]
LAGEPAATAHPYGDGLAVYLATQPDAATLAALLRWTCDRAGVGPVVDAPAGVEAVHRGNVLFLVNHRADAADVDLPRAGVDLLSGQAMSGRVTLAPRDAVALDLVSTADQSPIAPGEETPQPAADGAVDAAVGGAAAGLRRHVETLADGRRRTSYRRRPQS